MIVDPLVDRDCVILDGQCDCVRLPGNSLPECKRYLSYKKSFRKETSSTDTSSKTEIKI